MNITSYQHIGDSSIDLNDIGRVVGLVRWLDHTNTQTEVERLRIDLRESSDNVEERDRNGR